MKEPATIPATSPPKPMTTRPLTLKKKIVRYLKKHLIPRGYASRHLFEELLVEAGRSLSLDELLVTSPAKISAALHLSSFNIFLRKDSSYILQGAPANIPIGTSFRASGATVYRVKRERRPSPFRQENPDAWQLLATPQEIRDPHSPRSPTPGPPRRPHRSPRLRNPLESRRQTLSPPRAALSSRARQSDGSWARISNVRPIPQRRGRQPLETDTRT